jgi:hypothetical protein
LPPAARAARAAALLGEAPGAPATISEVTSYPPPWPESLAAAVMTAIKGAVSSGRPQLWPVPLAAAAARRLPARGDYAAALDALAAAQSCPPAWSAELRRAANTIALRRAFLKEIR